MDAWLEKKHAAREEAVFRQAAIGPS